MRGSFTGESKPMAVVPDFPDQLVVACPKVTVKLLRESKVVRVVTGSKPETPGHLDSLKMERRRDVKTEGQQENSIKDSGHSCRTQFSLSLVSMERVGNFIADQQRATNSHRFSPHWLQSDPTR